MGVEIKVDARELRRLHARLSKLLSHVQDTSALLEDVAGLLESQTKRRISDEKEAPDGTQWKPWSTAYARMRKGKHSLLIDTQALLDDIAGQVEGDAAVIGSSLIYAGPNQRVRPFLGLSRRNSDEILQLTEDWLRASI